MKRQLIKYYLLLLACLWFGNPAFSQNSFTQDSVTLLKIQQAIDSIYNLNFDLADSVIAELDQTLSDYPGVLLLKAFYASWKYRPIKKDHASFSEFESYLKQGIEQCEEMLKKDEDNVEANFFMMACHAYLAELYVNNGQNFKALGEAKTAYKYIKVGFDLVEEIPEFYFSSGIYNYYREKFPEENPFYKSFIWFFRSGDMEEGLQMLRKGSELAIFTKAECFTYLFHIYLRYEDKPAIALQYSRLLKEYYPRNLHYISNYVENLIRMDQYEKLLPLIQRLQDSEKAFYKYQGHIYYATYLENFANKQDSAIVHYKLADEVGEEEEVRVPHYDSMLYLGLGRINKSRGNVDLGNQYLKKSVKAAEYIAYRKDAEELLEK